MTPHEKFAELYRLSNMVCGFLFCWLFYFFSLLSQLYQNYIFFYLLLSILKYYNLSYILWSYNYCVESANSNYPLHKLVLKREVWMIFFIKKVTGFSTSFIISHWTYPFLCMHLLVCMSFYINQYTNIYLC